MFVEWGSQGSQDCREYIEMYGDNDQGMYKVLHVVINLIITHYTVVIDIKKTHII